MVHIIGQKKLKNTILIHFIIASIVLHFLFLLSAAVFWVPPLVKEPSAGMEVPAYVYQNEQASGGAMEATNATKSEVPVQKSIKTASSSMPDHSTLSHSKAAPTSASQQVAIKTAKTEEEPIHLIGDKHVPPKPLAKIIGRALAKKLTYPKAAVDFRVRGTVYVGFSIHPDGSLTGIRVVQSSQAGVLDEAALRAMQAITPLQNVSPYVKQAKFLVVGIVFR